LKELPPPYSTSNFLAAKKLKDCRKACELQVLINHPIHSFADRSMLGFGFTVSLNMLIIQTDRKVGINSD